jgi:hypothetical protein
MARIWWDDESLHLNEYEIKWNTMLTAVIHFGGYLEEDILYLVCFDNKDYICYVIPNRANRFDYDIREGFREELEKRNLLDSTNFDWNLEITNNVLVL